MFRTAHPSSLTTRHFGRTLLLAWLLMFAQLFVQIHSLGHLDDQGGDGQDEDICQLCLLGSNLHAGGAVDTAPFIGTTHSVEAPVTRRIPPLPCQLLFAFSVRAPPLASLIPSA